MIMDSLLNESSSVLNAETVTPLFESWITGQDTNELFKICNESGAAVRKLDENTAFAETLSMVAEMKGDGAKADLLMESTIKDYFNKFIEVIRKLWAKTKAFVANLLKSIQVSMVDVTKSLNNISKYIDGKDFSQFTYLGYNWKQNGIATKISDNASGHLVIFEGLAKSIINIAKKMETEEGKDKSLPDLELTDKEKALLKLDNFGIVMGQNDQITPVQATDMIKKAYGYTGSKEEIKGFSAISIQGMIKYLKGFENNSVLKDLKKNTDELFAKSIKNIKDMKNNVDGINNQATIKKISSSMRSICTQVQGLLSAYNTCIGTCIKCEKSRFSEYRSVVASAVRYTPSNKESK